MARGLPASYPSEQTKKEDQPRLFSVPETHILMTHQDNRFASQKTSYTSSQCIPNFIIPKSPKSPGDLTFPNILIIPNYPKCYPQSSPDFHVIMCGFPENGFIMVYPNSWMVRFMENPLIKWII